MISLGTFVKIPNQDFEICATQVTQAQWEGVMGSNPSHFKGENRPVEMVYWNDCQNFIALCNQNEKEHTYSLPTDAQWLSAFGEDFTTDKRVLDSAWCWENSGGQTHDVGTRSPNELGIYDMRGNVWEWVKDGCIEGYGRVLRGGCWGSNPAYLRSAELSSADPTRYMSYFVGLRLVRTKSLTNSYLYS